MSRNELNSDGLGIFGCEFGFLGSGNNVRYLSLRGLLVIARSSCHCEVFLSLRGLFVIARYEAICWTDEKMFENSHAKKLNSFQTPFHHSSRLLRASQ